MSIILPQDEPKIQAYTMMMAYFGKMPKRNMRAMMLEDPPPNPTKDDSPAIVANTNIPIIWLSWNIF